MNIAIVGFGAEGKSNLEYYRRKFPRANFTIFDERNNLENTPDNVEVILGADAFSKIQNFDLVLRSAGVAPHKISQESNIWSSTREFFEKCPAPIIGVTGTKGKGTVSSFIAEILRAAGKTAHLVGNIGVPSLEILPQIKPSDIVVYEVSSFQLWDLEKSPHVAVLTLIEPDHLDVHKNLMDYHMAKAQIFRYQNDKDVAVYNIDDVLVREIALTAVDKTGAIPKPFLNKKFTHIEQRKFYYSDAEVAPVSVVKLPGEHNLRNAAAAINAVWDVIDGDVDAIARGLANFDGLPHRLKFVREVGGVKFYNDSIATTPGSVSAAMKAFDSPKILILGGKDKGADYRELGEEINQGNVRMIVAIGENRSKIIAQLQTVSDVEIHELDTKLMPEIVEFASQNSMPGDIVILSPAASSFDMFKNYQDRGEQFVSAVNSLEN